VEVDTASACPRGRYKALPEDSFELRRLLDPVSWRRPEGLHRVTAISGIGHGVAGERSTRPEPRGVVLRPSTEVVVVFALGSRFAKLLPSGL